MTAIAQRRVAGATAIMILLYLLQVALFSPSASADHIPSTGPIPANCAEWQVNQTGAKSPSTHPAVSIDLTSWHAGNKGFNFSVSGLLVGQSVDLSVKSGQTVDEAVGYFNGSHSWSHDHQNAISHVRMCVFGTPTTTTTEATTTTTEATTTTTEATTTTTTEATTTTTTQPATTTTQPATTTTQPATTTTQPATTTTQPATTTTEATTTTTEAEVLGTTITTVPEVSAETLPFTGFEAGDTARLGLLAMLAGGLMLFAVRGKKEEEGAATDIGGWSNL